MDVTTAVTRIPASRQKSCNACTHAKRRCDRRTPICSRCKEKKAVCVYGKAQTATNQTRNETIEVDPYIESLDFGSSACSFLTPTQSLDVDCFGAIPMDSQPDTPTARSIHVPTIGLTSTDDILMDPYINFLGSSVSPEKQQWLVPADHGSMTEPVSSPIDDGTLAVYQKMAGICVSPTPLSRYA